MKEAGIALRALRGSELSREEWTIFHRLYQTTFARYGNYPAMTKQFFGQLAQRMGESIMVIFAEKYQKIVAASFFLIGSDTLYGRYWGSFEDIPALHFETCYYMGLEHCIAAGLQRFEPGAQGEHKISRGFLPTLTYSLHWIAQPAFHRAIAEFLSRERLLIEKDVEELNKHSPFRRDGRA